MKHLTIYGAIAALALFSNAAHAAGSAAMPGDNLATARQLLDSGQWSAALAELRHVNDTSSADWNNLMGYSLRKSKTPDFAAAERYYDRALQIDPQHRGALEYSGELYLMKGELPKAEVRLESLAQICASGCDQRADLEKAIARYKAAGNKWTAQ